MSHAERDSAVDQVDWHSEQEANRTMALPPNLDTMGDLLDKLVLSLTGCLNTWAKAQRS